MKKLLMWFMLFIATLLFPISPAIALTGEDAATALHKLDILKGYPDGSLGLQRGITRAEFVTLLIKMLGLQDTPTPATLKRYVDITSSHWAFGFVQRAHANNLISGYPDNTFRPNNNVTFAEAQAILIRALGYEKSLKGTWPNNVITLSAQLGIPGSLAMTPNQKLTRGEVSVLIYNSLTVTLNEVSP